ncbi:aminotransferase class I/II-fold pyridoxal phosphate-dependent enzyme [Burkholderia gladioli]|uniref:aminotransferase class I/II-fold pyridoxal phosphate-dependent enzyme n=1 Tax=Burkholderia gladioli TaxID=28095 RepID=UPI001640AEFA|nr:aminotransferase class I/II-fold pyridoxal phosphate-dependent enzyme [Burkholderia gladioli]
MQATYSEEIVAGTVEPAPPAGFRFVDKAAIRGEPALAARLAARKGSEHQDGVFLDLWPSIFLSDAHDDHIHVLRDRGLLFVTRYVGPPEREPALLAVLHRHARAEGRALCYLDMSNRRKPDIERECGLLSTPLGVVQTIDDIGAFGIEGARMRKLRYLVSKFGRDAACRVVEYTEPTPEIDSEIRAVMAAWSREKGVVNKVDAILADMRVGNLLKRYRVYLTYLGERLQNVVVLSHIDDGYITDQEYFLPDMPLGGTEYAYVTIIGLLKAQGYRKFSLGLTWGLFEPKEGFSDVEGWALVNRTEGQLARIFQRGVQNHQYKNKYDPAEYPLYLYRSADSRPQIIKQCMGQFFRSGVPYEEIARQIEADEAALGAARGEPPAAVDAKDAVEPVRAEPAAMPAASPAADGPDAFFDATAVDPAGIRLDLVSDSWAHLGYPFVRERARRLLAGLVSPDPERGAPGRLLGMEHSVLTTSGRGAERVFFSLFPARRRTILQNIPFFSTRHNAVKAGFVPLEIPDPRALDAQCREIFRGGIDMARLRARLDEQADDIAMVMIELCNNAAGGYPSSLAQLTEVSALCRARGVPLVLDITRILRNAELIRRHEPGRAAFGLWQTVAAITACADVVMGSLCKDFGLGAGGILAAHDARLIGRARRYAEIEGALLDHLQTQLACASFGEREALERAVSTQLDFAARLGEALAARGVPALLPVPGHCVLVPADAVPGYAGYRHPREALLRVLYERHGVRAGIHLPGSGEARVLERCIRLALPIGLPEAAREAGHPDELAARLAEALAASVPDAPAARVDLPDLLHAPAGAGARPPGVDAGMDHGAAGSSEPANRAGDGPGRRAGRHLAGEPEAIAIVGMAGRFPGAGELSAFWRNLVEGGEAISEIPAERWDWREHYHPDPEQAVRLRKSYGKWGGFLDEVDCFDPLFFWMAPRRIAMIDPQERLFLEECWKALEDAGYPPARLDAALRERTGVFGGLSKHGYSLYAAQYAGTQPHTSPASMVGRVSHFFDLKGPSVAIDNHCASSLVAVHEACEYLRHGGGELAIAGGVSLCLHPSGHLQLSLVRMLSRDASSAAFGAGGSGYVPGEGVGVVVLKRLAQAVADGDPVHAVIRAGALSHNGRMRYYGQPDAAGQAAAIRAALASADLDPRSISYIEAAASGVEGSDAVEMAALTEVFGERRGTTGDYAIGSVKPAIGHGEASSGMAQLMRAALSLSHATLTPTRLPARLSPAIDFERLPFRLATRARPWEPVSVDGQPVPRRAGVTAIGNGVNAHLVLEEWTGAADAPPPAGSSDAPHLFVLSAQDRARLAAYVERWIAFLEQGPVPDFARMLRTLQSAREPMAARLAVAVADRDDLLSVLRAWRAAGGMDGAGVPRLHLGTARRRAVAGAAPVTATAGLDALAAAWVGGQAIAWDTLYPAGAWRRTGGLPTYPFARERYWISDAVASASGSPQGEPASARHD